MDTKDGGATWSNPKSLTDNLGQKWESEGRVMVRMCDVTPQWHHASRMILATGYNVRYRDSLQHVPCPREAYYFTYGPMTEK